MSRTRFYVLLFVLAAAPAAALVTRPLTARATSPALRLRGGMADVDPVIVAKVAVGLAGTNGLFLALAPEQASKVSATLPASCLFMVSAADR
jgi:hypothetical protein